MKPQTQGSADTVTRQSVSRPQRQRGSGPLRSRRSGATRDRLVAATIELARATGPAGLTASAIAKAAGVAPPNFYVYFENADECIRLAAESVAARVGTVISALRADMHRTAPDDADVLAEHYETVLNLLLSERRFWEVFWRFSRDSSTLGTALRQIARQARSDLVTDLLRLAKKQGVPGDYRARIEIQAELILASIYGIADALVDERIHDVKTAAHALARGTISATLALFEGTGTEPQP